MSILLALHLLTTIFMTGLIWVVQIVIYPQFADIDEASFSHYETRYQKRITWIVLPVMTLELGSGVLLFLLKHENFSLVSHSLNLIALGLIWLSTALLQVPCHNVLKQSFDLAVHRKLVVSNWIRTALWSLRSLLLLSISMQ